MGVTADATGSPLLMFLMDWIEGSIVYRLRLEPSPVGGAPPELRPSVDSVIRWSEKEHEYSAHAAVSGGTILALIKGSRRTVIHDGATGADAPGPRLRRSKRIPIMLPVGEDTMLVMNETVRPGRHCFEALRRVPGGGWRADALPDPPIDEESYVTAYFARGSRAWISFMHVGTLSLDMEQGAWRMEGTWELPLRNRGLFVPELGLVVGLARDIEENYDKRYCHVCAVDVEAQPPAVGRVWAIPAEHVEQVEPGETVSLAHLGNGRFCIARSIVVRVAAQEMKGTSFTLVDVTRLPGGDHLDLATHGKVQPLLWPWAHLGHASFLQPA